MTAFAHVDGHPASSITVHVPGIGPWWADVVLDGAPDVSGAVTVGIGNLSLSGTAMPDHNGTHALRRSLRIVAGGGCWGSLLEPRHYHNDAQIRARTVAEDAAREAGEALGSDFAPSAERIGIDYVRQAGPASRALEDVIGDAAWWVDYGGVTRVGERPTSEAPAGSYEVLEYVLDDRVVVLAVDDPSAIIVGSVLTARLDTPQTARELTIDVTGETVRIRAWCGGEGGARGRLAGLLRGIARRSMGDRLYGLVRYRVVQMSGDRVELQIVRRGSDMPDAIPVSMVPGLAGAHAELAPGAEVLVQFVEGDRRYPIVTHFAGKDGNGWTPAHLVLSASSTIKLGSASANDGVALSSEVNARLDDIAAALDALAAAVPVPNDGGVALQAPFKTAWGPGTPPTPAADVGSTKVLAE